MDKLKPCPFCGGKADIYEDNCYSQFYVQCGVCGCSTVLDCCEENVVAAWNMRVEENGGVH